MIPILKKLQGRKLGVYTLAINGEARRVRGHFDVYIYLKDKEGDISKESCIEGLYSLGHKDSSYHFFDAQFFPTVHFGTMVVNLIEENLSDDFFKLLGSIIRPGGQFYLSYINDEVFPLQIEKAFKLGIPLSATVLGRLLFMSGCIRVRSFFGVEGRFRIDGEKPMDERIALQWAREMLDELNEYITSEEKKIPLDMKCRQNARTLIEDLDGIVALSAT